MKIKLFVSGKIPFLRIEKSATNDCFPESFGFLTMIETFKNLYSNPLERTKLMK